MKLVIFPVSARQFGIKDMLVLRGLDLDLYDETHT